MNDREYVNRVELEGNIRMLENNFVARCKGTDKEKGAILLVEFMREKRGKHEIGKMG